MNDEINFNEERNTQVFNTPLEVGFRSIFLLSEIHPKFCSLERLTIYDYLLLHSGDVENGPNSLHPAIPHRSCEIIIKREVMKKGLLIMNSKQLVSIEFNEEGIFYKASDLTKPFLDYFESDYSKKIKMIAKWVNETFKGYSDKELEEYIKENLEKWGGEFTKESLVRGGIHD